MSVRICPNCGAPAKADEQFCEQCGTILPVITLGDRSRIFDLTRMEYVIKQKFWNWGNGPIFDAEGNEIGKIFRKILSIRHRIEFQELEGTISASIEKELISVKPTYDLHEGDNGPLIGRFSKSLFSLIRPHFEFEDPQTHKIILSAQGEVMSWDYNIFRGRSKDQKDKVAEIHKADGWNNKFFVGSWNFSDNYGVKILDPSIDRRLLLGFIIIIDNTLFDINNT